MAVTRQDTPDLLAGILVGTICGMVLLGVPASLWTIGKWAFHRHPPSAAVVPQHHVMQDIGKGAMAGSTAAFPAAMAGGVVGLAVCAFVLVGLLFIDVVTLVDPFAKVTLIGLLGYFAGSGGAGAVIGFMLGTFFGSAAGAISGGVHALLRH